MTKDDGGPAFPDPTGDYVGREGMSLRDYFAGQAIATLIFKVVDDDGGWCEHSAAAGAYLVADAMLEARKK